MPISGSGRRPLLVDTSPAVALVVDVRLVED
jgi:hypothetical protein